MSVELICIAERRAAPPLCLPRIALRAGQGIQGDRYFGSTKPGPGRNLTLVEAESVEAFAKANGLVLPLTAFRRNLVTRGVHLNDLVGQVFTVGAVRLRGVELCEPCATLGRRLATPALAAADVVRQLAHRAGLRADVLSDGEINVGDPVQVNGPVQTLLELQVRHGRE